MKRYKVGDKVRLNLTTITPFYASVIEVGNTYVIIKLPTGRKERVLSKDFHNRFISAVMEN